MGQLPAGTVTFLFTDIEGSTRLWEEQAAAMSAALALHDSLLRDAVEAAGGHVIKTTGDGLLAVFGSPADAVAAAVSGQRALDGGSGDRPEPCGCGCACTPATPRRAMVTTSVRRSTARPG